MLADADFFSFARLPVSPLIEPKNGNAFPNTTAALAPGSEDVIETEDCRALEASTAAWTIIADRSDPAKGAVGLLFADVSAGAIGSSETFATALEGGGGSLANNATEGEIEGSDALFAPKGAFPFNSGAVEETPPCRCKTTSKVVGVPGLAEASAAAIFARTMISGREPSEDAPEEALISVGGCR